MSGLTNDDDSEEDVNSLLNMIGGTKKGEEKKKEEPKEAPPPQPPETVSSEPDDFSARIKTGMTEKQEAPRAAKDDLFASGAETSPGTAGAEPEPGRKLKDLAKISVVHSENCLPVKVRPRPPNPRHQPTLRNGPKNPKQNLKPQRKCPLRLSAKTREMP